MKRYFIIFVSALFILTGCVSQKDFDDLLSENDDLESKIEELEDANDELNKEIVSLKEQNDSLQNEIIELKTKVENTEREQIEENVDNPDSYEILDVMQYDFANGDQIVVNLIEEDGIISIISLGEFENIDICFAVETVTVFKQYKDDIRIIYSGDVDGKFYDYIYMPDINRMENAGLYGDLTKVDEDVMNEILEYSEGLEEFMKDNGVLK